MSFAGAIPQGVLDALSFVRGRLREQSADGQVMRNSKMQKCNKDIPKAVTG
jgi:hypothetical protein